MMNFVRTIAENEDYGIENYGENATVSSIVNGLMGKTDFEMLQDINATCVGNFVEALELCNKINGKKYQNTCWKSIRIYST